MSTGRVRGRWGLALLALMGSVVLAGCSLLPGGSTDATPASRTSGPPASATAVASPSSSPGPTEAPGVPSISISDLPSSEPFPTATAQRPPNGLSVSSTRIRGRASTASWDITIPVFSGPAVADEVNRRVRAAANDLIAQARRQTKEDRGAARTLTGEGTVGTNDGRTVQVRIMFVDHLAGTASPNLYVTTTVVDVARARPVLLDQVIQNPPEGLRVLKDEVVKVAKGKGEPVDAAGLAPRLANWANWQTSPAGLTFHFDSYQLGGRGIRTYTIPWSRARLVLSAYGEKLLT